MLTEGALARLPNHSLQQAADSEPSIHSDKGFEAPERPPAVAAAEPEQQMPIFQFYTTIPEFITMPLLVEGQNCLKPDAYTNGVHFGSWVARLMSSGPESEGPLDLEFFFLTLPGNFEQLYKGPRCAKGGTLPLPLLPPLPGVALSGPPLSYAEKMTKGTAPWRLKMLGAPERWAGRQWEQSPPDIDDYATPAQKHAWRLRVGPETNYKQGSTPQ